MDRTMLPGVTGFLLVLSTGLATAALLSAAGYAAGAELMGYLVAVSLAVALGAEKKIGLGLGGEKPERRLLVTGAAMVGIGYAAQFSPVASLALLVRPAWIVGLACMFLGHARTWHWRAEDVSGRANSLVLAALVAGWGWFANQPTFLALGSLALVAWCYAVVLEILPDEFTGVWRMLIPGAFTMALAIVGQAHWGFISRVLRGLIGA